MLLKLKKSILLSVCMFLLNGCYLFRDNPYDMVYYPKDTILYGDYINPYSHITNFHKIAQYLVYPMCDYLKKEDIIYVTDFVNEKNLENKTVLGFILSNETRAKIHECTKGIKIKELQLANILKIGKNGSRMLSRNLKDLKIKNLIGNRKIIIGSYILTDREILFYLKLIDLKTADTIKQTSISSVLTGEIESLDEEPYIYTPMHL